MFNVLTEPKEYASITYEKLFNRRRKFKRYFLILNLLTVIAALFTTVLTALMVSKMIYKQYPDWFFFATSGSAAMLSLVTSLLNFFIIKGTIDETTTKLNKIENIMVLHFNKLTDKFKGKNADFNLYNEVAIVVNSEAAKQEVKNG
ncbi:MAG: DUF4231 domain-containing protein [Mycoplasmataceae bacterium]|nr:DUF4231 domain-containing protein [Mycoplasmataceae bacterium]